MKILLDTNIVLDIFLKRESFFHSSYNAVALALDDSLKKNNLYVSASIITDIYYIASRNIKDIEKVKNLIRELLSFANVLSVTDKEIHSALDSQFKDFEDSVLNEVAVNNQIDIILTRNKKDFINSDLEILLPDELIDILTI